MRSVLVGWLLSGWALAQGPAAEPVKQVEALAAQAAEHYEAGRFRDAVEAYKKAYELQPVGPVLYNIAFIYDRELDDPLLARDFYRRYVNAPDAEAETRVTAFERLQVIEDRLRTQPPPPQPPRPVAPGASTQMVVGLTVLAVGVVAAGTGGTFAYLAGETHTEFEETDDAVQRARLKDDGQQQALIGDIAMGVGAAAIIAGVVLLLTDGEPAVEPAVEVQPGAAQAGLRWRF